MKEVMIYTDGACSGNPGPGGWGTILIYKEHRREMSGGEKYTTNNRMEIMAAIKGLEALKEPCSVRLYSDSAYLINSLDKGWLDNWIRKNWVKSDKNPVENRDLWETVDRLRKFHRITWIKVKGHSVNELNNRCDELARSAITHLQ